MSKKPGQKKIWSVSAADDSFRRQLGASADHRAARLRRPLALFVRVDEDWSQTPAGLRVMGYERGAPMKAIPKPIVDHYAAGGGAGGSSERREVDDVQ